MAEEKVVLTAKTAAVLEVLKDTGAWMFAEDIAATDAVLFGKGGRSVNPILTNLVKKGFVEKQEATRQVVNKEGVSVERPYKQYHVTDLGSELEYSIKAEKAEKAE